MTDYKQPYELYEPKEVNVMWKFFKWFFAAIFIVSSLTIGSYLIADTIIVGQTRPNIGITERQNNYIQERTLSVSLAKKGESFKSGTAWIFDRLDYTHPIEKTTYMLATNLHVVNAADSGSSFSSFEPYDPKQTEIKAFYTDSRDIVQPIDIQLVNIYNVGNLADYDPEFKNQYLDIAFIEVTLPTAPMVQSYNLNPTKFSKRNSGLYIFNRTLITESASNAIAVAGYPSGGNNGDIVWKSYRAAPNYLGKFNDGATFKSIGYDYHVNSMNLGAGASGSMAINSDLEVVGIYWGGVKTDDKFIGDVTTWDAVNGSYDIINLYFSAITKDRTPLSYLFQNQDSLITQ